MRRFATILTLTAIAGIALAQWPGSHRVVTQWMGEKFASGIDITANLKHHWNPSGVTNSTDLVDGLDGTLFGGLTEDSLGWNMGNDDTKYVLANNQVTNGTSYTAMVWVWPDVTSLDLNGSGGIVLSDRAIANPERDWQLNYADASGFWTMTIFDTASSFDQDTNTNVIDSTWQHLAMVVDSGGGTIDLFVNGVSDGSSALTITPADASTNVFALGTASWAPGGGSTKFHDYIDKVRFYSTAKTQAFIQEVYDTENRDGH